MLFTGHNLNHLNLSVVDAKLVSRFGLQIIGKKCDVATIEGLEQICEKLNLLAGWAVATFK